MSEAEQKNLRNVIVLAMADGKLNDDERRVIDDIRHRLGLKDSQFHELVADIKANGKTLSLPKDSESQRETVRLLVEIANADQNISDRERSVLELVARKLEIDETELQSIIDAEYASRNAHAGEIETKIEDAYEHFSEWDPETREKKFDEIGDYGKGAVVPLIRAFESYRRPRGMDDPLELKQHVAKQLARIGDRRAVYYLAQQINLGEEDDEVTNHDLRCSALNALNQCADQDFSVDREGLAEMRRWWTSADGRRFNQLAF